MSAPAGEERRKALLTARGCHIVLRSNTLKPASTPAPDDPWRLIEVEHPVFKKGWASAEAFTEISFGTPVRYTVSLSDIVVGADPDAVIRRRHAPRPGDFRGGRRVSHGRTGTASVLPRKRGRGERRPAVGLPRPTERDAGRGEPIAERCASRSMAERYRLAERPDDVAPDFHVDPHRRWLFQNLATGEWLDGSAQSGELTVRSAFDALCPGTNPEAPVGIAYRDPRARYPRELQGRWYDDRRALHRPAARRSRLRRPRLYADHGRGDARAWQRGSPSTRPVRSGAPLGQSTRAGSRMRDHGEFLDGDLHPNPRRVRADGQRAPGRMGPLPIGALASARGGA